MPNQNKILTDDLNLGGVQDQAPIRSGGSDQAGARAEKAVSRPGEVLSGEDDQDGKDKMAAKEEVIGLAKSKIVLARKLLNNIKENNDRLLQLLSLPLGPQDESVVGIGQLSEGGLGAGEEDSGESRIIEGVFDGENMIGPDGKQYNVPPNYASKSKLVEGDILKLAISPGGIFIYKQIGPIERARVVGVLERGAAGEYLASADGKRWRLLTASVTYYKGEAGDEVVVLVPKNGESKWAAVENIVRKTA